MSWPDPTKFTEAMQNYKHFLKDPKLREAEQLKKKLNKQIWVSSGRFAAVYAVGSADKGWYAVRCFKADSKDREDRYGKIHDYLEKLNNKNVKSVVDFDYQQEGILIGQDWYPILRMGWVEGETLDRFVNGFVERIKRNKEEPEALRNLAKKWLEGPVKEFQTLGISHNDVQHGNVMVTAQTETIKLVDYDGMCVPDLEGKPSDESGHENFQNPKRTEKDYGRHVDNFPNLVVYVSLLGVAADPGLWSHYNQDNLIFKKSDFADPKGSELFLKLRRSSDKQVACLTELLEEYCSTPLEEIPYLGKIVEDLPPKANEKAKSHPALDPRQSPASIYRKYKKSASNPILCGWCWRPTDPDKAYCQNIACAAPLPGESINCTGCRDIIYQNAKFCGTCGTPAPL